MNRTLLLAAVLLTAGLAGCLGPDDAPVDAANATATDADSTANTSLPTFPNGTPAPTTLQFRDCQRQTGFFPVPASAYEDRLPEGFSFPVLLSHRADLYVNGHECQLPDGSTVSRAWTSLYVDPPDAWEHPDAEGHLLVLAWMTTSEREASVNAAWGFDPVMATGEVSLSREETPAASTGTLTASAGPARLSLESTVGGEPASLEIPSELIRVFALADDGTVAGAMDVNWTDWTAVSGEGTVSGTEEAGIADEIPAYAGLGNHGWGFDQRHSYVDLPPREGS